MTKDILKDIKIRNDMHSHLMKFKGTHDEFIALEVNLRLFSKSLKKKIKCAKRQYHSKQIDKN